MALPKIIITDNDTIRAIGLRHLLTSYFNVSSEIIKPGDISAENNASLYFTSTECYISLLDFFAQRRLRTIILSARHCDSQETLNTEIEEEELITRLNEIINSVETISEEHTGGLSTREIEVLRLIALGHINKEIADKLSISINTVLSHRKNITSKLGIRSASGLAVYAMMNGYISSTEAHR